MRSTPYSENEAGCFHSIQVWFHPDPFETGAWELSEESLKRNNKPLAIAIALGLL